MKHNQHARSTSKSEGTPPAFTATDLLQLSFVPHMTPITLRRIVERFGSMDALRGSSQAEFAALRITTVGLRDLLNVPHGEERTDDQMKRLKACGARLITFCDDEYPADLRTIYSPPVLLFVRGTILATDADAISIVGSRSMTSHGRHMATRFAHEFAELKFTVVSGLESGVNVTALAAAVRCGGRAIAMVPHGIDMITGERLNTLADVVSESGAIVSEFPMGSRTEPVTTLRSNRIVSGLSRATIVIECELDQEPMSVAGFAIDQNREVFAVPGRPTDANSAGTNHLIRENRARLVQSVGDVMHDLGLPQGPPNVQASADGHLTMFEKRVLAALTPQATHIDEIAEKVALAPHDVLVNLLMLELKGLVRQLAGKRFAKTG